MLRRRLIKLFLAVSVFGLFTEARAARKIRRARFGHMPGDLVLDQSGCFNHGAFVMGALAADDLTKLEKELADLRRKIGYRSTLSFSSRDKFKKRYAMSLIDLWLDKSTAKLHVFVVKEDPALAKLGSVEKLSAYTSRVSQLIDISRPIEAKDIRLVAQAHFKPDQQTSFENLLRSRNKPLGKVEHISESESDLLQLVDLVVGTIQAEQPSRLADVSNPTKLSLSNYLKKKLSVKDLTQPVKHKRCSVTFV